MSTWENQKKLKIEGKMIYLGVGLGNLFQFVKTN